MLVDSLNLISGTVINNATVASGPTLPSVSASTAGQLFYLTSTTPAAMNVFDGTAWVSLSSLTKLSQLTNDAGFITASSVPTKVSQLTNDTGFITSTALSPYAKTTQIPTKVSQLTNDSNYLTTAVIPTNVSQLTNDASYVTTSGMNSAISSAISTVAGGLKYAGTWNAATNSPTITSGSGTKGTLYKVATAGTTNIDGTASWSVGDMIAFNGTTWDKIDGQQTQVVSFNNRIGAITLTSTDVTTALGFTPVNPNVLPNYAPVASPTFTGTVNVPTPPANDNSTKAASTAYVQTAISGLSSGGGGGKTPIYSYFPGNLVPTVGTLRYYPQNTVTLSQISLFCNSAPTTAIVVDLKKNGVSLFGSGTKPTISAGQNVSTPVSLNAVTLTSSDYLTIDIVAGNGADMTARIDLQ